MCPGPKSVYESAPNPSKLSSLCTRVGCFETILRTSIVTADSPFSSPLRGQHSDAQSQHGLSLPWQQFWQHSVPHRAIRSKMDNAVATIERMQPTIASINAVSSTDPFFLNSPKMTSCGISAASSAPTASLNDIPADCCDAVNRYTDSNRNQHVQDRYMLYKRVAKPAASLRHKHFCLGVVVAARIAALLTLLVCTLQSPSFLA